MPFPSPITAFYLPTPGRYEIEAVHTGCEQLMRPRAVFYTMVALPVAVVLTIGVLEPGIGGSGQNTREALASGSIGTVEKGFSCP